MSVHTVCDVCLSYEEYIVLWFRKRPATRMSSAIWSMKMKIHDSKGTDFLDADTPGDELSVLRCALLQRLRFARRAACIFEYLIAGGGFYSDNDERLL